MSVGDGPPWDWADDDDSWEGGQPPPDGYHGDDDDYTDDGNIEGDNPNLGGGQNFPGEGEGFIGGYPDEIREVWDYLMDIDKVSPANIRGLGFADIYECIEWMQSVGVLNIGGVVEIGGLYHPVIGEYEETEETAPEDDYNGEDFLDTLAGFIS